MEADFVFITSELSPDSSLCFTDSVVFSLTDALVDFNARALAFGFGRLSL